LRENTSGRTRQTRDAFPSIFPSVFISLLLLLLVLLTTLPVQAAVTRTVIIDTDPGTDDAMALFLTLKSPELDVHASHRGPRQVQAGNHKGWENITNGG
jgi:hypothetical protein